ncbi:MAG TPA: hypothetical protein VE890_16925 [Thermoguttaceae bacterium]|nr:hypothetical protein [Thermoguttaceae bacterium]
MQCTADCDAKGAARCAVRRRLWPTVLAVAAVAGAFLLLQNCLFAQEAQPTAKSPYRHLAPGVVKVVDPAQKVNESFSRHDIVELLAFDPAFDWAKDISFRHDLWVLQFQFKPVRMISVEVPQASGLMRRKLIWYMVYSVTNTGKVLHPTPDSDQKYEFQYIEEPIRFIPEFLLEGHESLDETKGPNRVYPDRVIPVAMDPIRRREDPRRRFYNSVEISGGRLAPGKTAWGVATWEDIHPKIDRFSIYVQGLTNAYTWKDDPAAYKPGAHLDTYRTFLYKTLKLNFWRPGDEFLEHEREIRYGVPGETVDYEWVYR